MIQYKIKSSEGVNSFMEILKEQNDGYEVMITCIYEDYKKELKEFLNKQLFDTCLRTGYLTPMDSSARMLASA